MDEFYCSVWPGLIGQQGKWTFEAKKNKGKFYYYFYFLGRFSYHTCNFIVVCSNLGPVIATSLGFCRLDHTIALFGACMVLARSATSGCSSSALLSGSVSLSTGTTAGCCLSTGGVAGGLAATYHRLWCWSWNNCWGRHWGAGNARGSKRESMISD